MLQNLPVMQGRSKQINYFPLLFLLWIMDSEQLTGKLQLFFLLFLAGLQICKHQCLLCDLLSSQRLVAVSGAAEGETPWELQWGFMLELAKLLKSKWLVGGGHLPAWWELDALSCWGLSGFGDTSAVIATAGAVTRTRSDLKCPSEHHVWMFIDFH